MTSLTLPSSTASPSRVFVSPIPTQPAPGEREENIKQNYQKQQPEMYFPPSPPLSQQEGHLGRYQKKLPPLHPLTHTTSMKYKEKKEPPSPPLSPLFSRRRRFPRWLKQMSAPAEPRSCSRKRRDLPKEPASPTLPKTTLYYGSPQVRTYLHDVLATNRMEEVITQGFPTVCGQTVKDPELVPRVRTLRLTLTPAHCRATETEIYGDDNDSDNMYTSPTACPQSQSLLSPMPSSPPPPQAVISPPQRIDSLPSSKDVELRSSPSFAMPSSLEHPPAAAQRKEPPLQRPSRQRQPALFVITPSQPDCLQRYESRPVLLQQRRRPKKEVSI